MKFESLNIGENHGVFIVAELSGNHGGSLKTAIDTIKAAKKVGADAIKLQTYTPDTMTLNSDKVYFRVSHGTVWDGEYQYEVYKRAFTPWEWHKELFRVAREEGLVCFSTPFDISSVDFLESLDNPIYKIASPEIVHTPLIEYVATKGKPIIFSTGIAQLEDVELAVETARNVHSDLDMAILKCTAQYPAPIEKANLTTMMDYVERFKVIAGLSDHTLGISVPVVATALGASIIEKHFILDRGIPSADASFSLDVVQFGEMVNAVREAEKAVGEIQYIHRGSEVSGQGYSARSIFVTKDLKQGDMLTNENIAIIRPGHGIHPKYYHEVLGKKVLRDLESGEPLNLSDLDEGSNQ